MINQLLILIIIIILVIIFIYYKYFNYTIINENVYKPESINSNELNKIELPESISEINMEQNYDLLYKYITLNSKIDKNLDTLMSSNNLIIEYPQETNYNCKKNTNLVCINPNLIDYYLQSNSKCDNFNLIEDNNIENNNIDNFTNLNINSKNIIKLLTKFKNKLKNKEHFNNLNLNYKTQNQKIIWVYWENINNNKYPTFIKLCIDTMKKHLGKYNLIFLNEKTIKLYLPDIRNDFNNLKIAQKVDYYRIALLYKYGGVWIDTDIIVMRDFEPIFNKLDEGYDYIGFGCTGFECSYGYYRPSNWVMASQKNSILMKKCLEKLNKKLDLRNKEQLQNDLTYHDYGKIIIWDSLDELKLNNYTYYHFTSEYDGARDINKHWIHVDNFFNTNKTIFLNESKLLFVVLYNSEMSSTPKYNWIYDCDESRLLYGNEWICSLYRKSLNI